MDGELIRRLSSATEQTRSFLLDTINAGSKERQQVSHIESSPVLSGHVEKLVGHDQRLEPRDRGSGAISSLVLRPSILARLGMWKSSPPFPHTYFSA